MEHKRSQNNPELVTLRDAMAIAALPALIDKIVTQDLINNTPDEVRVKICESAYLIADAMLKVRSRPIPPDAVQEQT